MSKTPKDKPKNVNCRECGYPKFLCNANGCIHAKTVSVSVGSGIGQTVTTGEW